VIYEIQQERNNIFAAFNSQQMILDKIENAPSYYGISANLKKGFEYIRNTNLLEVPVGRHEISGNDVFALVSEYQTKAHEECIPEAHQIFTDIQFIISGEELIGYVPQNGQKESIPYQAERDIAFYNEETTQLWLRQGMFAVFFPQDIHRPCMLINRPENVKKVVIKVRI
jgi:YhcH/YjgK/YiaL family protein